eukprot:1124288-Pleurochrysis_carterae.AAC.1
MPVEVLHLLSGCILPFVCLVALHGLRLRRVVVSVNVQAVRLDEVRVAQFEEIVPVVLACCLLCIPPLRRVVRQQLLGGV